MLWVYRVLYVDDAYLRRIPLLLSGLNRAAAAGCEAVGFFADALAAGAGPLMRQAS